MSGCNEPRAKGEACNCCGDEVLREQLTNLLNKQTAFEEAMNTLQSKFDNLPPILVLQTCEGEALASNAQVAQCADIDRLHNDLDNLHQQLRYFLSDCSGVALDAGARVASCDDLSTVDSRVTDLLTQLIHLQQEVNRIKEIADTAKQTVDAITLNSNIDESTLQGILTQISNLESRLSSVAATADAASAGVDAINAKP